MRAITALTMTVLVGSLGGCGRSGLKTDLLAAEPHVGGPRAGSSGSGSDPEHPSMRDPDAPAVFRDDCTDETTRFIHVVTTQKNLYRFDPLGGVFHLVGTLECAPGQVPFSMAVDRGGTAFVSMLTPPFTVNAPPTTLWRVNTIDASCQAIPQYMPGQMGFKQFGMGIATDEGGPEETLYIAGANRAGTRAGLAKLDTTTFVVTFIGVSDPPAVGMELTGSGEGRLFALFSPDTTINRVGELDKATAEIIWQTVVPDVEGGNGWALAHWGGDLYLFTSSESDARATRYRIEDDSSELVAVLPQEAIVGAGVSTCARLR
jgi:hypothetical protein